MVTPASIPSSRANSIARFADLEPKAATSASGSCESTRVKSAAIAPVPMMPQRTLRSGRGASLPLCATTEPIMASRASTRMRARDKKYAAGADI